MAEILGETYKDDIRRHLETLIRSYPDIRFADPPPLLTSDRESQGSLESGTHAFSKILLAVSAGGERREERACQGGENCGLAGKRTETDPCAHAREEGTRGA